jgi:hypothetical protein
MANFRVETNPFRFGLQDHHHQRNVADMRVKLSSGVSASAPESSLTSNIKTALKLPVSKKNNSKKTRMPPNYVPPNTAVICGRGKICNSNPGNRKLRSLIKEFLQSYGKATNKVAKTEIVSSIMDSIKKDCGDQPAFVKKEEGTWWEVDDAFAREKIGCIFRDSLFNQYRSSTKAKLARRKQQLYEEEQTQQQQHKFIGSAAAFGGMGTMDIADSAAGPSYMSFGFGANQPAKQLSQMLSIQGAADLGSNTAGIDSFLKQQQQQQLGLFSAGDSFLAQQQSSHRRDLLRHAPSMFGLSGSKQSSYMEPSVALGEAFDLLQNLQPARNHASQLFGGLQQQQEREAFFKDLLGAALAPSTQHPAAQVQKPPEQADQPQPMPREQAPIRTPKAASRSTKHPKSSKRKRRSGKNNDNDDLESLPDDISGIFD